MNKRFGQLETLKLLLKVASALLLHANLIVPLSRILRNMKPRILFILLTAIISLSLAGCGVKTQSFDTLFSDATTQIEIAQRAGADRLVSSEFNDAKTLLDSSKLVQKSKQRIILAEKAYAKARLAEALAKQKTAENEANRLEAEIKVIEEGAGKIKAERQIVENELKQIMSEDNE